MNSVNAFITNLIDYAGLFPPAKLPLLESLENYFSYLRTHPHASVLSRFIIPIDQLDEVTRVAEKNLSQTPGPSGQWLFSSLGKQTSTAAELQQQFATGFALIRKFNETHRLKAAVDALEFPLPTEFAVSGIAPDTLKNWLNDLTTQIEMHCPALESVFVEVPLNSDVNAVVQGFKNFNSQGKLLVSVKLRTGGVTTESIPSVGLLSQALWSCVNNKVPFKATAGLHSPIRVFSRDVATKMHGFFNVFIGAMIASAYALSAKELEGILEEENAKAFHFTSEDVTYKNWRLSAGQIENLRSNTALSFGSCSFLEPIEHLQHLNLIT